MGSKKVWERGVALTSTLHWLETDLLACEENLTGLAKLNRELVARGKVSDRPSGWSSPWTACPETPCRVLETPHRTSVR